MPSLVLLLLTADYLSTHEHVMAKLASRLTAIIKQMEEADAQLQKLVNDHCESMNEGLEQLQKFEEPTSTDTMSHHLSEVLKEVIPCYLERDDLEGLAEDLAIYVSKLLNTETPCKDMHSELSSDLLFLLEVDD